MFCVVPLLFYFMSQLCLVSNRLIKMKWWNFKCTLYESWLRSPHKRDVWFVFTLFCMGFMFYVCYLYLFMCTGVHYDFHVRWCLCLTVTWWVSHMEEELITLPEHLSSPLVFSGVHVAWSLVFCVMFCRLLFVLLLLSIVLSVHFLFIISHYLWYFQTFLTCRLWTFKVWV